LAVGAGYKAAMITAQFASIGHPLHVLMELRRLDQSGKGHEEKKRMARGLHNRKGREVNSKLKMIKEAVYSQRHGYNGLQSLPMYDHQR
jgi:hypothetical protein